MMHGGISHNVGWALWNWLISARGRPNPTTKAEEILAERYARGELSKEEYLSKIEDLKTAARRSR